MDESTAPDSWLQLFAAWFGDALTELADVEVNAMQLATVDESGRPAVRTVLCKGFDESGIEFFTNYNSDKGRQLAGLPYAAAVFAWVPLERQVRIAGPTHKVPAARSEEYFATRPRGSQIGAWASPQSAVIASRAALDALQGEAERRFEGGSVPLPPHWGGYRIEPEVVEFWQGRRDRLHDRLRYRATVQSDGRHLWTIERLAP